MKLKLLFAAFFFTLYFSQPGLAREMQQGASTPSVKQALSLDEVLKRLEGRYSTQGFSARFFQSSTLKALDITETASGTMIVKRPAMMRWMYEKPEKQLIITDGKQLWIYRPAENQVTVGNAPVFFGDGKGASFLSNIQSIRKKFNVTLEKITTSQEYVLKLVPSDKSFDLVSVFLVISGDTFDIVEVVTYNSYEDETRIELSNIKLEQSIDDAQFKFVIPQGAEVMRMDG